MHGNPGPDGFQPVERCAVDPRRMRNGPMKWRNWRNGIHGLERRSREFVFSRRKAVLLKSPSLLRYELKRGLVIGGGVTVPNNGQLVANSPMPEMRIMSSPKPGKLFSTRSRSSGMVPSLSMER